MTSKAIKLTLTSHVIFSVGWLGTVAVFIALAVTGLSSHNYEMAIGAVLAMKTSCFYVIVPFCLAASFTGVLLAVGTKWGLVKHYWIIVKLILTTFATLLLLMHLKPISMLVEMTAGRRSIAIGMHFVQLRIMFDAIAGLIVLIAITAISVYKPWGRTYFSLKGESVQLPGSRLSAMQKRKFILIITGGLLLTVLIVSHLFKAMMFGH